MPLKFKIQVPDFPGSSGAKNLTASAGDTGSVPDRGEPRASEQPSACTAATEAHAPWSPCSTLLQLRSSPHLRQQQRLEQQLRLSTAKNNDEINFKNKVQIPKQPTSWVLFNNIVTYSLMEACIK